MMTEDTKVLFIHSVIWPYRLPVFKSFGKCVDLDVLFCKESESRREWNPNLKAAGVDAEILESVTIGPVVFNYTVLSILLFREYDIVVMDGYDPFFPTAFLALFAAKLRRKPYLLWTEHTDSLEFEWLYIHSTFLQRLWVLITFGFVNAYQIIFYQHVDHFIAFSEEAKRYLYRRGVERERVTTGIQVIPAEQLHADPNPDLVPEIDDDAMTILSLGYLSGGKGVDDLIKAYKDIATSETELVIAGSGEEETALRRQADNREDIKFVGYVEGERKSACYAKSDIFVLPTRYDAWGIVVNEAMYYGLPIITTTTAGSKWIVDENGYIIEPDDSDLLADRLLRLVTDPDLRLSMGRKSREKQAAFDPDTMAKTLEKAVNEVKL